MKTGAESAAEFNKWFEKECSLLIKKYADSEWLENFKVNLLKAWQAGYNHRVLQTRPSRDWLRLMSWGY
jgi:hypothetical protein